LLFFFSRIILILAEKRRSDQSGNVKRLLILWTGRGIFRVCVFLCIFTKESAARLTPEWKTDTILQLMHERPGCMRGRGGSL
jgi:hypothetical protein